MLLVLAFLLVSIFSLREVTKLRKRYELFTGGKRRPEYNMEVQFSEFHKEAERMEEKYEALSSVVRNMDKSLSKCVQKVGVVRYNPFDEVGGNLCYAVALLDIKDNGVVLNGIHSRTGSFTYAKPIELGISEYVLSEEELKALEIAKNNCHAMENIDAILDEIEERFPRTHGKEARDFVPQEETMNLDEILVSAGKTVVTTE